jgi:hypothetical protein
VTTTPSAGDVERHRITKALDEAEAKWARVSGLPFNNWQRAEVVAAMPPPDAGGLLRAARADLERDRSIVAVGVERVTKAIEGRAWLREAGRGSYAYNDDRYQQEFGGALDEIEVALAPLRKVARDWSNCSTDAAEIKAARALAAAPPARSDGPSNRVERPYAFCCNGDPDRCDCVSPSHGTAWFDEKQSAAPEQSAAAPCLWCKGTGFEKLGGPGESRHCQKCSPEAAPNTEQSERMIY